MRAVLGLVLLLVFGSCAAAQETVPVYDYTVVRAYPHDRNAFTQGLFFEDGQLYESTGQPGRSSIRKVELETGKVLQQRDIDSRHFGEGSVAWKGRLIELTWQSNVGFVYDLKTFEPISSFRYDGEGWGLTHDGKRLIMSDGTAELRFLDPDTQTETGRVRVTAAGRDLVDLNELEFVEGEVWANVWQTNFIARIDPVSGHVLGWIDLSGLLADEDRYGGEDVLNGIAYEPKTRRLLVTGKQWAKLYEITLKPRP